MQTAVMQQPPRTSAYGAMPIHRKPITNPAVAMQTSPHHMYPDSQQGHSRTRTTSSSIYAPSATSPTTSTMTSQYPTQYQTSLRRTPTSSTSSTTGTPNRSNSGNLRRSSSTRSGSSPTSYVAMMRKQKATVWCDRSQYEDPRILAQQRQAKMRANIEVAGGPHHASSRSVSGGSAVGGVRSKFGRHHGLPKASLFAPTTHAGSGVPLRLSATEVDEGDDEDAASVSMTGGTLHQRSGSGRSSLGSGRRLSYANANANANGRLSSNSSPHQNSTPEDLGDLQEEPTPNPDHPSTGYFIRHTKTNMSTGSGSSGERNFGQVGQMQQSRPQPSAPTIKGPDNLGRKGSVDERTTRLATRLYVANPDLSD